MVPVDLTCDLQGGAAMKGIVIPTSLNEKPYLVEFSYNNENDVYHKEIGCDYIDMLSLGRHGRYCVYAVVDDSGMINGSPVNERFLQANMRGWCAYPLYGKVIITSTDLMSGETIELRLNDVITTLINSLGFDAMEFANIFNEL